MADKFYAQFNGPIRETQVEAERDYEQILLCLNKHCPRLVPLALRECKPPFVYVKAKG